MWRTMEALCRHVSQKQLLIAERHSCRGWRIGLGCAGAPAIIVIIGGLVLPDTPNSLIERGHIEKGRKVCIALPPVDVVCALFPEIVVWKMQSIQLLAHMCKKSVS